MPDRCVVFCLSLILFVSLGLTSSAHAIFYKLCGPTQFTDALVLTVQVEDDGPDVFPSTWTQFVPHFYALGGSGVITRRGALLPGATELQHFIGRLTIVNTTDSFRGNPSCTVSPEFQLISDLPAWAGTAVLFCFGGEEGPFEVTLEFTLTLCRGSGFPVAAAEAPDPSRAAGSAPNEYRAR